MKAEKEFDMGNIYEVFGRDLVNQHEFFVGWSLNEEEALELKKKSEENDANGAYEFFIKYPADRSV